MFVTIFVIILISVVKYKYRPYVLLPRAWYRSAIGGRGKVKGWRKRATGSESLFLIMAGGKPFLY